jgi:hypothetical protein
VTSWALVDDTGGATTADGSVLTPVVLDSIAAAAQQQLNRDYSPHCGGGNFSVRRATADALLPGECVFAILPALPDSPGAIAYHAADGSGLPVAFDAITLSDTLTGAGNSLSVAISHELLEAAGDPGANLWADDGSGNEFAFERCDAVESQTYAIGSVYVSNFLLDSFFVPGGEKPYDYMSLTANTFPPTSPFQTASNGYQITRSAGQGEHQVTAERSTRRPNLAAGSRRARRGVRG